MTISAAQEALQIAKRLQSINVEDGLFRIVAPAVHYSEFKDNGIFNALSEVSDSVPRSYAQVLIDIQDEERLSWAGTAHEIREVLRNLLEMLAPDDLVQKQEWYQRDKNSKGSTQRQRVRYVLELRNAGSQQKQVSSQIGVIEERIGRLVRSTYSRASDASHRYKDRVEVLRILRYFEAFAHDLLDLR